MADLQKARLAFMALVKELDPDVECTIPAKPTQGTYPVTLAREGEEQVVKVSEKDFLAFENDEKIQQKLEEKVLAAIDELPGGIDEEEEEEDEDLEDADAEEDDAEEEEEEEEEEPADED